MCSALLGEDFLTRVLELYPNGSINIFDVDLRYVFAGGQGLAEVGLTPAMLLGRRLREVFPPDLVDHVEPFYLRAFGGDSVQFDLPVFDRTYSISTSPFSHDGEDVATIIAVAQDVTAVRRMERVLAETETRLQLALDVAGVSTWELDVATATVRGSESVDHALALTLHGEEATLDRLLGSAHPEDRERVSAAIRNTIDAGSGHSTEFRVVREDGTVRWVLVRAEPLMADGARVTRVLGAMVDVTARHQLEQRLGEINQQKDEVLVVHRHELRQPVHAVLAALAVMQSRATRPTGESASTEIEREIERMSSVLDDLLDLASVIRGEITLRKQILDLNEVVRAAVEPTTPRSELAPEIVCVWSSNPVLVNGDRHRLHQVLVSLMTNALRYSLPSSRIEVEVSVQQDVVQVRIADTGTGIDPVLLPHIFEPFTRGDHGLPGLGVGLAIVRRIVEQHGGEVTATSGGRGHGAEFVVRLPKA
jgi:PAS domain S-box-containing protein